MKNYFKKLLYIFTAQSALAYPSHKAIVKSEFIFKKPSFKSCHASTLTETNTNKILCSYFAGSEEGKKDVSIWISSLENNSWSEPKKLINYPKEAHWNPVLFTLPSNEILLFYKVGRSPGTWSGFLKRSLDNGNTFSESEIFPSGIYGPIKNRPLFLDDETLLCPSSQESYEAWACYMEITDKNCKDWKRSFPIIDPQNSRGIIQPTLFLTKEGNIKMLARSFEQGYIYTAISTDKGCSFSDAIPTTLPNPNSAIDAIKLFDGRVLLVYNHSKKKRFPINIAISEDDGKTWKMKLSLEKKRGEYSYPAVIQSKDGLVHITYTWKRKKIKYIVLDPKFL